jgi:hypothetical protein
MTDQESKDEQMRQRCIAHARGAARQAKMKGLAPYDAGVALIAESLALIYGIDIHRATNLVLHVNAYANEILQSEVIEERRISGATEAELDFLRKKAAVNQNALSTAVLRDLVPKAAARAQLMGATALPPNDWATLDS